MLIRIISLFALLGMMMSSGYGSSDPDEEKMGGEGFGGVVSVVAFLGAVVLVVILVLAALAVTGQFESDFIDPVT